MNPSQPGDIDREDLGLLKAIVAIWSGLFAMGAGLYAAVAYFCLIS